MNTTDDDSLFVNLADERLGATVLYSTDDFFASHDNLLKAERPIFLEEKFTERGKWMDGWESRRKRDPGHDFCIVRLGVPGVLRELVVDTAFFRGNYPSSFSIEGASLTGYPSTEAILSSDIVWTELVPQTNLEGNKLQKFTVPPGARVTHLRFHIFPDGGVARLRAFGEVLADPRWMGRPGQVVDLASIEHGAVVASCNDMFFGSRHNLVFPNRAPNMGDGWETKRSRRPGPDWVVVRLAAPGTIERIVMDTLWFRGNSPESAGLCVGTFPDDEAANGAEDEGWTAIFPRTKLLPHTAHVFEDEVLAHAPATHVRMRIWPDGGVSRLRLFGTVSAEGRERAALRVLDSLAPADAEARLATCCGSKAFAQGLAARRPFASLAELTGAAADVWSKLSKEDWEEAFRAHPRIGENKAAPTQSARAAAWSRGEQAKVETASPAVLQELADVNRTYEEKFGRTYIVCATGKSAEEMLAIAKARLSNDPDRERGAAADEQRKITELRLAKLFT